MPARSAAAPQKSIAVWPRMSRRHGVWPTSRPDGAIAPTSRSSPCRQLGASGGVPPSVSAGLDQSEAERVAAIEAAGVGEQDTAGRVKNQRTSTSQIVVTPR